MPQIAEASTEVRLDPLRDAFFEVFAAQRRLRGRDAKVVDGISFAQMRLLQTLARDGAMPTSQLASTVAIRPSSITQMLDGLERRGFVERTRSTTDRRVVTVTLTPSGSVQAEGRRSTQRTVFDEIFADLADGEIASGVEVLRRCAAYLDAL
jgi:MarR family transcriptional regulator, organic hydroperoxide resistance regulator